MALVLTDACLARRFDPVPLLLGLVCTANIGSAATPIGNPQNMLIGETLRLSFAGSLAQVAVSGGAAPGCPLRTHPVLEPRALAAPGRRPRDRC